MKCVQYMCLKYIVCKNAGTCSALSMLIPLETGGGGGRGRGRGREGRRDFIVIFC